MITENETGMNETGMNETVGNGTGILTTPDRVIGSVLSLCLLVGVPGNLAALAYFLTQPTRNASSCFFKYLYIVISSTDLTICLTILPVVLAYFAEDRESVLFANDLFCNAWGFLWSVLPEFSVSLIMLMSIARCKIIVYPSCRITKPYLAFIIPGVYFMVTLSLRLLFLWSESEVIYWYKEDNGCFILPIFMDKNYTANINMTSEQFLRVWDWELPTRITIIIQFGLPIIPIFISVVISVFTLWRSRKTAKDLESSAKRQNEATKTIIILTMAYIFLNIPGFIGSLMMTFFIIDSTISNVSTVDGSNVMYAKYYNNNFWDTYSYGISNVGCVGLNSLAYPMIYLWRMEHYRRFLISHVTKRRRSLRTKVTKISLSKTSSSEQL